MLTVTKQYRTETGHRLCQYDGKCAHVHGHSYLWEVTATAAALTDNGMVMDFADLKRAMEAVLEPLDHALVLWGDDPIVGMANSMPGGLSALFRGTNGTVARLFLWPHNPTAEHFAQWAATAIQQHLDQAGQHVAITRVRVWETATSFAEWRRRNNG